MVFNKKYFDSGIDGALGDWNYDVNSSNMGQYIMNSKASMEVAEFEKFLFLELPASFAGGELVSVGWRAVAAGKYLGQAFNYVTKGGPTFAEYRAAYWAKNAKPVLDPLINRETGQVWKQYMELHHRFIPQRAKWAPNWLLNNRFNLKPVSSLEHALVDPYRARFAPRWVKETYNLTWR